jgi:recombination protein U
MTVNRHVQGAKARTQGKAFEDRLTVSLEWYTAKGYASIEKTPEPMKVLRNMGRGQFLACFEKKAQPDFTGTIRGGRSIMFEAKYTTSDRLEQSRVLPGQADYLSRHLVLGARCYVIAGFATGNVYRIPWEVWQDMKQRFGRKYVREADLEIYRVEQKDGRLQLLKKGVYEQQ